MESNVYALRFNGQAGDNISINIPRANTSLTESVIRQNMQDMIGINIITTSQGKPLSINSVVLVATETVQIV